jgi:hypothetical protein
MRPQVVGWACSRLATRLSRIPPVRTTAGQDSRRVARPVAWSRWRSRAAITHVRSMHTAMAQDIGPCWPCWAAVSRMWVNDPAPAMAARTRTGARSRTRAAVRRVLFIGLPPFGRVRAWDVERTAVPDAAAGGCPAARRNPHRRGRPLHPRMGQCRNRPRRAGHRDRPPSRRHPHQLSRSASAARPLTSEPTPSCEDFLYDHQGRLASLPATPARPRRACDPFRPVPTHPVGRSEYEHCREVREKFCLCGPPSPSPRGASLRPP